MRSCQPRRPRKCEANTHILDVCFKRVLLLRCPGLFVHHLCQDGVHIFGLQILFSGLQTRDCSAPAIAEGSRSLTTKVILQNTQGRVCSSPGRDSAVAAPQPHNPTGQGLMRLTDRYIGYVEKTYPFSLHARRTDPSSAFARDPWGPLRLSLVHVCRSTDTAHVAPVTAACEQACYTACRACAGFAIARCQAALLTARASLMLPSTTAHAARRRQTARTTGISAPFAA